MGKVKNDLKENKSKNIVNENILENNIKDTGKIEKNKMETRNENTSVSQETRVFKMVKNFSLDKDTTRVINIDKKLINNIEDKEKNNKKNIEEENIEKSNKKNIEEESIEKNNKKNIEEENTKKNNKKNIEEKNKEKNNKKNNEENNIEKNNKKNIEKENTEKNNKKNNEENNIEKNNKKKFEEKNIEKNNKINNEKQLKKIKEENINNKQLKEKNEYLQEYKVGSSKKKTRLFTFLIMLVIIFIGIIFSTIFAIINKNNNKIINGIVINEIEISNLTKNEAVEVLDKNLNNVERNIITVKRNEFSKQITLSDIDGKFNITKAVDDAYNYGRNDNLVKDNYKIINSAIFKNKYSSEFTYNKEKFEQLIKEISLDFPDIALDSTYTIKNNNLIIKNSTAGVKIKKDIFERQMIDAFSSNNKSFNISVEQCEQEKIDIDKIYNEVYKEPVNAYYKKNPMQIFKEEDGLDFEVSLNEVRRMLLEDKQEYIIPLKVMKAKVTVSDLDQGAFPDKLSTFTTRYSLSDINRNTNIDVAAKSINNVVLMPGEVFSFNDLIGECSIANGYKAASVFLNGKVSTGIGGGICQVSTTTYNAVLRANLEIVKRRNHSMSVAYVPVGQDAMVSMGTSDFQFKNNRDYPIKIYAYTGPGTITCEIYGLQNDVEYEVELESRTISRTETRYKVETYKILYLNGKEVTRTLLSTDTYKTY